MGAAPENRTALGAARSGSAACSEGQTNRTVAAQLPLSANSVCKWRERFRVRRLEGLTDEPRPGTPRKATDNQVVEVITRTLEGPPAHATQWTTPSMAEVAGLSKATISRIWQTFGLQSHRLDTFKLSADPQFVEKVRDIVGLYLNPPDHALVLCLDEKSQVHALDRTRPLLPMRPGIPAQQTHDYMRHGTTSLFAALNVASGKVIGQCHRRHRHQELLKFLNRLDADLPPAGDMHVIMDNYGTHRTPKIARWFARHPRYHVHFTPTSASWLTQVERFFSRITTQRIRRGTFENVRALETAIDQYLAHHNEHCKPFVWTATADAILDKIKRFCERTSETRH